MTDNDLISCLTVFTRTRKLQETLGDLFGDRELLLKKDYYCEGILYDLIMYNTIFPNGPEEQEKYPFEESERMCEEFSEIMFNDILCAKHKLALIKEIK